MLPLIFSVTCKIIHKSFIGAFMNGLQRRISMKATTKIKATAYSGTYPFILSSVSVSFVLVNLYETAQSWQEQQRI